MTNQETTIFSELPSDWKSLVFNSFDKEFLLSLSNAVTQLYRSEVVFPNRNDLFAAFRFTSVKNTKCILLGQDPYHGFNQAHGLAFSVQSKTPVPPSLRNLLMELNNDLGINAIASKKSDLTPWANQGVLLLNAILTVNANQPNSHKHVGWNVFTSELIRQLVADNPKIVCILLGNSAKKLAQQLQILNAKYIVAPHPSPLSAYRGFFQSSIFSKTNQKLIENGLSPIDWNL